MATHYGVQFCHLHQSGCNYGQEDQSTSVLLLVIPCQASPTLLSSTQELWEYQLYIWFPPFSISLSLGIWLKNALWIIYFILLKGKSISIVMKHSWLSKYICRLQSKQSFSHKNVFSEVPMKLSLYLEGINKRHLVK